MGRRPNFTRDEILEMLWNMTPNYLENIFLNVVCCQNRHMRQSRQEK